MPPVWRIAGAELAFPRPIAAGIVNVTTDSMFEGARSGTPERAIADGLELAEAGFDMIDVGAIAARAGAPVAAEAEAESLIPAVAGLARELDIPVSADTFSAEVARRAIEAGAAIVNDISGARDPGILDVVAEAGAGYVLMHIEGPPRTDREPPGLGPDPVARLKDWFDERIELAAERGVAPEQIALDPGLDFDLTVAEDLEILRRLGELRELGHPVYLSLSRKDFIGAVLAGSWEERLPAPDREWGTLAAVTLGVTAGAEIHRLHDRSALQAMRIAGEIAAAGEQSAAGTAR